MSEHRNDPAAPGQQVRPAGSIEHPSDGGPSETPPASPPANSPTGQPDDGPTAQGSIEHPSDEGGEEEEGGK